MVSQEIMERTDLTPESKAIYAYLCSYSVFDGSNYPGTDIMMKALQMGANRFYKHLKVLIDAGIVEKIQERDNGKWIKTAYILSGPHTQRQKNDDDEILAFATEVCRLLNNGRESQYCRGRVKLSKNALEIIDDLLKKGIDSEQIKETALNIGTKTNADFFELGTSVLKKWNAQKYEER